MEVFGILKKLEMKIVEVDITILLRHGDDNTW